MSYSTPADLRNRNPNDGTRWAKNVVLMIKTGDAKSQEKVVSQAQALASKCGVQPIDWTGGPVQAIKDADNDTRLHLVAHGNENGTRVAGGSGPDMAEKLVTSGGLGAGVGMISLVCCYAGKEATGFGASAINYAFPSFARSFHAALADPHGVYTLVHARTAATMVYLARYGGVANLVGKKMVQTGSATDAAQGYNHQAKGSKYRYYWLDDKQVVEPVYG